MRARLAPPGPVWLCLALSGPDMPRLPPCSSSFPAPLLPARFSLLVGRCSTPIQIAQVHTPPERHANICTYSVLRTIQYIFVRFVQT